MKMLRSVIVLLALGVAGCAGVGWPDLPPDAERISYKLIQPAYCGDCFGTTILVTADGRVWVEHRHWERQGRHHRKGYFVDPQRYQAFRAALAPYRPEVVRTLEDVPCDVEELHSADVQVTWTDDSGEVSRFFRLGCINEKAINTAVLAAPELLEIGGDFSLR